MDQKELSCDWWSRFKSEFAVAVSNVDTDELCKLWAASKDLSGKIGQTRLYDQHILPAVGKKLGLQLDRESISRVDWVLSERHNAISIPMVCVESETVTKNIAGDELPKLCSLSAPLKVLIVCEEWDTTPGAWPNGGQKNRYLRDRWEPVIAAFGQHWPQLGVLAIIVGEYRCDPPRPVNPSKNARLSFWACAYSGDGKPIPNSDELLWRRHFAINGGRRVVVQGAP